MIIIPRFHCNTSLFVTRLLISGVEIPYIVRAFRLYVFFRPYVGGGVECIVHTRRGVGLVWRIL